MLAFVADTPGLFRFDSLAARAKALGRVLGAAAIIGAAEAYCVDMHEAVSKLAANTTRSAPRRMPVSFFCYTPALI